MIAKLRTMITVASWTVVLCAATSYTFAQTAKSLHVGQDPDLQAIRDNILTVRGMAFPKLRDRSNAKSASCCAIGDSRSHDVMKPNYETLGVKPKGKVTHERTDAYSPTATCWVISTHNLTTLSASGASYNLTAVPGGYSFLTSNQYQQTVEDVTNFVLNMNILNKYKVEIIANLKQFTNNYASYAQSLSVSDGSVLLYTKLESKGALGGRSWYRGIVRTTETCCPEEIKDPVVLKTALTTWVNDTVNSLPNKGQGSVRDPREVKSVERAAPRNVIVAPTPEPSPTPPRASFRF